MPVLLPASDPGAMAPDSLPGHLQQQPLLRVHHGCLARSDAEKGRVEEVYVLEKSAKSRNHLARFRRVGIVVVVHLPALAWNLSDCFAAFAQQLPERGRIGDIAGKAAAHADNGDRLALTE